MPFIKRRLVDQFTNRIIIIGYEKKVNKLRSHVKLREAEIEVIINTNWILRKRDFLTFSVVLFACMVNQHDVQLNSNPSEPEPRILNRPSISRNSNKR